MPLDATATRDRLTEWWERSILPVMEDYIRIPNKSPHFDPEWEAHGHMEEAVALIERWCRQQSIEGMSVEVLRIPRRTPLLYIEIPGQGDGRVLLYGHLDKQPEMTGWREGLGPWTPVRDGDRLYGRGGADDGYAVFASLSALRLLRENDIPHPPVAIVIEACEESGSFDLPHYLDLLADRIGEPDLVVCLDSGCGNYDQLWLTTSLRGMITGTLRADILTEGVHSGDASGIVPSSFRILRQLLERIEDAATGQIHLPELAAEIPPHRVQQARAAADVLGEEVYNRFPFVAGAQAAGGDPVELVLNRTWRAALAVTGADGLPPPGNAGNVLRPSTALKLSLRLPPTCASADAADALRRRLEAEPPFNAQVSFDLLDHADGWHAPALSPWLAESIERASQLYFGRRAMQMGEGGSIPFMAMLGRQYPRAQFVITGVLGPHANAHGPNEFLHIPTAIRLTGCVAKVIADCHAELS